MTEYEKLEIEYEELEIELDQAAILLDKVERLATQLKAGQFKHLSHDFIADMFLNIISK